jgi:hypothetical protein
MAASPKLTLPGTLKVNAAGWTTVGRRHPCTGGVAQNRTEGSRLYIPSRVALLLGSGMPGSMQTRSPILRCFTCAPASTTVPEASCPSTIGAFTTNGPIRPCW